MTMPIPLQLPGIRGNAPGGVSLALVVVAVFACGALAWLYLEPKTQPDVQSARVSAAAPAPAPVLTPTISVADVEDLRRHLQLTETELTRSSDSLSRAERQLKTLSTGMDRLYFQPERRQ